MPKYLSLTSAFVATLGFASIASAQDTSNKLLPAGDVVTVYDEIRRQNALPISVGVVNGAELETVSLVHPAEALNRVAGVNIHRGSGQEHLTAIRSPVLVGGAGAGSFLYLQDGVPLRAAGFANVNGLFEVGTEFARGLEVIKGPGPATYGSNAVHGLVNVVSREVETYRRVRVMGSTRGLASAQTTAPLGGGFQLSAALTHDTGFREDSGFDQQKFELKYQSSLGGTWDVDWLTAFNNLNQETAGFLQGDDAYRDDDIRFTNANPEAFRDGKSYRTQARFERNVLDGDTKLAITPYARRAEIRFLRHFVPGQALEKNAHSSVGVQTALFKTGDYNIGLDVEYTEGGLYEFQANPDRFSFTQGLHYDYDVQSFVGAAYAQKHFLLADVIDVDLGVRAEYTAYDYNNNASVGQSGRFIRVADRKDDFFTVTPKLSLSYQMESGAMLFARAARGSRAPQVTDLYSVQQNQMAGEADVETLDSLEAGIKFENEAGLRAELTTFSMWKDNFFFRNANGFNVVNGKTNHVGAELSFTAPLSNWLSVSGDGTLAKHTYNFALDEGSPANNITDGDRVDTAPDTLAHLRLTARPVSGFIGEIEWRHVGSYFANPGNTARYPGHDIFVLRSSYDLSPEITVFGRVDNLLNSRYADRADFAFGNERYFPGRPRTLFFGLSSEF